MNVENLFGLIGYPLSHSFSKKYFNEKFVREGMDSTHYYELFPIEKMDVFPQLLKDNPQLVGLNVTIPYKQQVTSFLDDISEEARAMGAVNTIVVKNGRTIGYNTDVFGFEVSLFNKLEEAEIDPSAALILGTGGAAKAVAYVLQKRNIPFYFVSRNARKRNILGYGDLTQKIIEDHPLIINTTPLGMYPKIDTLPDIPYQFLGENHLLFDLVYNPEETAFLKRGIEQNASTLNGLEMLHLQAEKAWSIWTGATSPK